ncbi:MAG: GreA/GreB family elongation factor, partial [Anaerotignum sp.]
SNESPLGMALLGQKVGATVMADTPDGEVAFKILNIQK